MDTLQSLITTGRIVDVMLAFVVLEIIILGLYRRATGNGIPMPKLLVNIGAGSSIMLALRAALTGADWKWIAVWLVCGLLFHSSDIALRFRRGASDDSRGGVT